MGFMILGALIGLCGVMWYEEGESLFGKIFRGIFGGIGGAALGMFFGFLISLVGSIILSCCSIPKEPVIISEKSIYSVVDNIETVGHFSLGCGNVKGDLRYYYITKEDRGEIIEDISSNNTYINKTNNDSPKCVKYVETRSSGWNWIGFDIIPNTYYILYVPENTIQYQYSIDLQ